MILRISYIKKLSGCDAVDAMNLHTEAKKVEDICKMIKEVAYFEIENLQGQKLCRGDFNNITVYREMRLPKMLVRALMEV